MGVLIEEQETTINYARGDSYATIWTSDTTVMTKLDKLCEKSDSYTLIDTGVSILDGEIISKTYRVEDKTLVSFRAKRLERESKPMTEEQRQEMVDRLARARAARSNKMIHSKEQ